jgi:hypothetical protein
MRSSVIHPLSDSLLPFSFGKEKNTFFFLPYLKLSRNRKVNFTRRIYGKLLRAVGNPCKRGNLVCPYLCKSSAIKKCGSGEGRKPLVKWGFL